MQFRDISETCPRTRLSKGCGGTTMLLAVDPGASRFATHLQSMWCSLSVQHTSHRCSLKSFQRTTGSPPPYRVPPQSDAGRQKVVSKVKFAPPPFCLFMEMTRWCGKRGSNGEQVRSRVSTAEHTTLSSRFLFLTTTFANKPTSSSSVELPIADEGQTLGTLCSASWVQSVCPFGMFSAAGPPLRST